MAGEVAHVVYGARVASFLGDKVDSVAYWAGTLFPDIRHLGVASRRTTHSADVALENLAGKSDFETGMRVHAWIDKTRITFLEQANMKEELPWHPFVPHALKLLEDERLYGRYDDWNLIHRALNQVYEEELQLVHTEEQIVRWHTILQDYFRKKPDDASRYRLTVNIGISEASAKEINSIVERLRGVSAAKRLMDDFVYYLEDLLK